MPKLAGKRPSDRKTYPEATTLIHSWPYQLFLQRQNGSRKCAITGCERTFQMWDSPPGALGIQAQEAEETLYAGTRDPELYDVCPYHVARVTDPPF